jgi:hypothetical protein
MGWSIARSVASSTDRPITRTHRPSRVNLHLTIRLKVSNK